MGGNSLVAIANQIKALEKKNNANVVEIGRLLHEADEVCEHGAYMIWLKAEFGWSHQTSLRYRSVYDLSQNPQIVDFAKLDISISALYLLADNVDWPAVRDDILLAAKRGRVTHTVARKVVENHKAILAAEQLIAGTDKDEAEKAIPDIDTRTSVTAFTPAKPTEQPDQATLDHVEGVLDARKRKPAAAATPTPADTEEPAGEHDDLVALLHQLLRRLWQDADLEKVVAEVGAGSVREIISWLKKGLDKHAATRALVAKADAAEPKSKPAKPAVAADDNLAIPGFLRRAAAVNLEPPKATTGLDEEAQAIDAELRAKKPWLHS